jgi:hypothetical protein
MDKAVHSLMHGIFNAMKGPLLSLLILSVIVALVRQHPGRLVPVRVRKRLPSA